MIKKHRALCLALLGSSALFAVVEHHAFGGDVDGVSYYGTADFDGENGSYSYSINTGGGVSLTGTQQIKDSTHVEQTLTATDMNGTIMDITTTTSWDGTVTPDGRSVVRTHGKDNLGGSEYDVETTIDPVTGEVSSTKVETTQSKGIGRSTKGGGSSGGGADDATDK